MRTLSSDQGKESSRPIFIDFRSSSTLGPIFFVQALSAKERNFCENISFLCLTKPVRVTDE